MSGIKMTKKLLDDYRKLKREIPILELELQAMREGDNGMGNSTVFDYRTGQARPQSVVGFDWPLYERRKAIIDQKKDKTKMVEKWVQNIEDGQARCVFRMFYIDGASWVNIASKIGYGGNADYPRKYIRDKYLQEHGLI